MNALMAIGTLASVTNTQATNKATLDGYSMLIVSKHLKSEQDYKNLTMVCKKFKKNNKKFRYNPISITDETKLFPNIETHVLYNGDDKEISKKFDKITHMEPIMMSDRAKDLRSNHYYKNIILDKKYILQPIFIENNGTVVIDSIKRYNGISRCIYDPAITKLVIGNDIVHPAYATGDNIREIDVNAFYGLSNIKTIEIKPSIRKIKSTAFSCCNLETLIFHNGLIEIGNFAFSCCKNLTKINFPDSLHKIKGLALHCCENLKEVTLGSSLREISPYMLQSITGLQKVTISNGIERIGDYVFDRCLFIKDISIPSSVTSIGNQTFNGCTSLEQISFDKCQYIDFSPLSINCCNNLQKIIVPQGWNIYLYELQYDDRVLLNDCTRLQAIGTVNKHSIDDMKIGIESINVRRINDQSDALDILQGVKVIDKHVFSKCGFLQDISLPDSIEKICYKAFESCSNLISIDIGKHVTEIEYSAFEHCTQLSSVSLPDTITKLNRNTFYYCNNLVDFNLPINLKEIDMLCFSSCNSFQSLEIPNTVTLINGDAFANCHNLTRINLPNKITCLSEFTFSGCYNLKSIEIPASVKQIEFGVFNKCDQLTKIILLKNNNEDDYRINNIFQSNMEFQDTMRCIVKVKKQAQ